MTSGTNTSPFTLRLPALAACTGDTATDFYFVQSYMVPASVDPSTLQFDAQGPAPQDVGANFSQPLWDTNGSPYVNKPTLENPGSPRPKPGEIINIPDFSFGVYPPDVMIDGAYNIGIACTNGPTGPNQMKEFWNTTITVSNSGTTWSVGSVPAAPAISSITPGDGSVQVAFTHAPSTPATSGYTVTATPAGGGSAVTATGAASPITVAGLTNGTSYNVTVHATNTAGNSPESAAVSATPNPGARPAVQNLSVTQGAPGSGSATVTWDPPTGDVPTGYDVTVSPAGGTISGTGTSRSLSGLTENTAYQVTVTPLHPSPYVGTPASVTFTVLPAAVVYQQLDVTVPEGALTITQLCGTGPTGCEVDFGTATLITTGTGAGQFYEAEAELHQLTVTDTRDEDPGWTATGTMGVFSAGPATFSGDQLGWTPAAVGNGGWTTPSGTYTQTVAAGSPVAPNTTDGLGNGATLATGGGGSGVGPGGLGVFALDAHLDLLIPVGQIDGAYSGVMTITAS